MISNNNATDFNNYNSKTVLFQHFVVCFVAIAALSHHVSISRVQYSFLSVYHRQIKVLMSPLRPHQQHHGKISQRGDCKRYRLDCNIAVPWLESVSNKYAQQWPHKPDRKEDGQQNVQILL